LGGTDEPLLIRRAQAGDRSAFDELVLQHQAALYGFLVNLTNSPDTAVELAQEVFVRAWRYLARFDSERPFRPWLYTIAANRAATRHGREAGRETVSLDEAGPEPPAAENVAAEIERRELSREVRAAIGQLSRQQREAVVLVELSGLTAVEAAAAMGCEAVTVRQHVFRAKKRLRELLASYVMGRAADQTGDTP